MFMLFWYKELISKEIYQLEVLHRNLHKGGEKSLQAKVTILISLFEAINQNKQMTRHLEPYPLL